MKISILLLLVVLLSAGCSTMVAIDFVDWELGASIRLEEKEL
ncbi:MAG: hypothetical protein QGH83_04095 [Candidatus Pacebacteria bacterium]|jgi:hypothetical protein|nr:hypothetical protein [Candidatus Paceibacterota bacterium]